LIQHILVFEFITGGGFSQQELPDSLAKEGLLMLTALVDELRSVPNIQLTVILDWRIESIKLPDNSKIIRVSNQQNIDGLLSGLVDDFDFIWPIAPEMQGELAKITQLFEKRNQHLLTSSSQAVAICSDKLLTAQSLSTQGIATISAVQLDKFTHQFQAPWVVKPKDGVGCLDSYYISNTSELSLIRNKLTKASNFLIQPYLKGDVLSLSCLFKEGQAWLLCCNRQFVVIKNGQFKLENCTVNINTDRETEYQQLINQIASIITGLSGYVGIDIIQPKDSPAAVLEINPRLTTSYAGINQSIGFNVAKAVIEMSENAPIIKKTKNEQIVVSIC